MGAGSATDVDPVREVKRLHLVLDDWYGGIRDDIDPLVGSLASDFTWVSPDGRLGGRDESVAAWQERRDEHTEDGPPATVEIEDITIQRTIYGVHQLTFRKHVRSAGTVRPFTCSLWLRETERSPTGLQWLHLTETERTGADEDEGGE